MEKAVRKEKKEIKEAAHQRVVKARVAIVSEAGSGL